MIILLLQEETQIVTDIFTITQKISISGGVDENQVPDSSTAAAGIIPSLTVSPLNKVDEEETKTQSTTCQSS